MFTFMATRGGGVNKIISCLVRNELEKFAEGLEEIYEEIATTSLKFSA